MEKNIKILVVDDDPVSLRLLEKTLTEWEYEVHTAKNGLEALEIFFRENIKFIIADWVMPVMDGLELCRKIRASDREYVYFIILTGKDKKEDIVEGLEAGADDYISKPFDRQELRVRVRNGERVILLQREFLMQNEKLNRLNALLEEIAWIDPLMDIGNRRSFYESIKKLHHRARRYDHYYGIIMCDIDDFKAYNDTYGHIAGDQALKNVAKIIKKSTRLSDETFRFGGEEIVILVPEQNLDETFVIAEKLRSSVESLGIEHTGAKTGKLTLSVGVASFHKGDREKKWEDILGRADRALYVSKSTGKNRVEKITN